MKAKQSDMFSSSVDVLPLFSGTSQRVEADTFTPQAEPHQYTIFACPICQDTGSVRVKKNRAPVRCTCPAGRKEPK